MIDAVDCKDVNGRNVVYYFCEFELPGDMSKSIAVRAMLCCPGRWADPTPSPELALWRAPPASANDPIPESQPPETEPQEPSDYPSLAMMERSPGRELRITPARMERSPAVASRAVLGRMVPSPAVASRNMFDDSTTSISDSESIDSVLGPETPPTQTTTAEDDPLLPEEPAVMVHETDWFKDTSYMHHDMNGSVKKIKWEFTGRDGREWSAGDDPRGERTMLDYFMSVFPPNASRRIILLTNEKLRAKELEEIDLGDLLKFFGILILITKFKFGNRSSLWSSRAECRYIPAPRFGDTTGMPRHRFDDIWRALTFSEQPPERPHGMSSERY
jgi:hypothetical protein